VSDAEPLVSVVTPFYNAATYLDKCIESVLSQTYARFEYLLVNNRSTDGSATIAQRWATRDPRIRLVEQPAFLTQVENYNSALTYISHDSVYVKVVQADDWLFPDCLARMVAVAEMDPTIVIVGSYYLSGDSVFFSGISLDSPIHEGRDICRKQLLWRNFFMGNPTTLLYRADRVRARTPFFETGRLFEDGEACFELLREARFGFVPQILSAVRVDNEAESIMGAVKNHDWMTALRYTMVRRFGSYYLGPAEFRLADAIVTSRYWRRLVWAALTRRGAEYFAFHRARLAESGEALWPSLWIRWPWRVVRVHASRVARAARRVLSRA
jgi:glycosyltransferase involved in cell wall biosynthesis